MGSDLLRMTFDRTLRLVLGVSPLAIGVLPLALGIAVVATVILPDAVAGQWVEVPGQGWVSAEVYYHDTTERYDLEAEKGPIPFGGHAKSTALFVTAAVGLIPNWDLWARGSVNSLSFSDAGGERSEDGLGDANIWLRVAPLKYLGVDFPFAIRGGVKLPIGDAPVDAEIIPLSEGQVDWEIMAEIGHSFWPASVYVNGWVGYRYRELNEESAIDPGEEIFFLAQVGGAVGNFQYKLVAEGWDSDAPVQEGLTIESSQRQYLQLTPSLWHMTPVGGFEVGWRVPLAGRNLPAGGALVIGYFSRFGI